MQSTMYLFQISNYDDPAVDRETVELLHQCLEFATMGIALPGAIAAKLIYPEKRVLAVTGDGGLHDEFPGAGNSKKARNPHYSTDL